MSTTRSLAAKQELVVGSRVVVGAGAGKKGVVAFIGETQVSKIFLQMSET